MSERRGLLSSGFIAALLLGAVWSIGPSRLTAQSGASDSAGGAEGSAGEQHIVIHLSHFTDDLHRCFMALKTANLVNTDRTQVTLYLDLEGVRMAERRQDLKVTWGESETTLEDHYREFTEGGGRVLLCPHCADGAQIGDLGLKRYAEIASEPRLSALWLSADKVIDY
jgi:predicted peroxiredoxin